MQFKVSFQYVKKDEHFKKIIMAKNFEKLQNINYLHAKKIK